MARALLLLSCCCGVVVDHPYGSMYPNSIYYGLKAPKWGLQYKAKVDTIRVHGPLGYGETESAHNADPNALRSTGQGFRRTASVYG